MNTKEKPILWLEGEVKNPPFSKATRLEAGFLLRQLQLSEKLNLQHSRSMPSIGRRCHELRIVDENATWRIIYRIDSDAIKIAEVFSKKTQKTSKRVIDSAKKRLNAYNEMD